MNDITTAEKPLISVITVVYNREDTVNRCIDSVLSQTFSNYEFIIVDDGSSDGTNNIVHQYLPNEKLRFVTFEQNKGANFARNRGIKAASGDFITFLDSDDYLTTNALLEIADGIITFKKYSHLLFKVSTGVTSLSNGFEVQYNDWLRGLVKGDYLHVVRREILLSFRFIEDIKAFESLFWFSVIKETAPQLYIDKELVIVESGRNDCLSLTYNLGSIESIQNAYKGYKTLIEFYYADYFQAGVDMTKMVAKTVILGIALGAYEENKMFIRRHSCKKKLACFLLILNAMRLQKFTSTGIAVKRFIRNKFIC